LLVCVGSCGAYHQFRKNINVAYAVQIEFAPVIFAYSGSGCIDMDRGSW